jgi:hypothetical protein
VKLSGNAVQISFSTIFEFVICVFGFFPPPPYLCGLNKKPGSLNLPDRQAGPPMGDIANTQSQNADKKITGNPTMLKLRWKS